MSGIIVGYYCDHEDEPYGQGTHLREHASGKKWPAGSPNPSVRKALSFGAYNYETHKYGAPPCPRAVPLRVTAARLASVKAPKREAS